MPSFNANAIVQAGLQTDPHNKVPTKPAQALSVPSSRALDVPTLSMRSVARTGTPVCRDVMMVEENLAVKYLRNTVVLEPHKDGFHKLQHGQHDTTKGKWST
jgi:hypothetical protein